MDVQFNYEHSTKYCGLKKTQKIGLDQTLNKFYDIE